ncbi:proline-rich Gla (G-carboxyglutamic acid) polypeptide 2 (predicted), isoform CRA_b [Rattus norvegicus]|uniref:Proline-rich Gla (G-carboxyglutamic acid) polypeptide 2 (Predicted), isoform CRA_b n=1 Tax=Rattus norvegicus TaxID=10116 RepID=A6JAW1_RAT|nr:proline-rich Gla (G-carboxyglutamic acid) polypeptide 2 (predicted), isoform CRA_b [Rattus norvegicus]
MRSHPSLLLVYMGLATCLDTLPHREQSQGAFLGKLCIQRQGRTGLIIPLSPPTPLSPPPPPGLPTYEQALAASGVHDAPPPPYSR